MKTKYLSLIILIFLSACSSLNGHKTCLDKYRGSWDYSVDHGPGKWADLDPQYKLCEDGRQQSPINIDSRNGLTIENEHYSLHYKRSDLHIVNNGHFIEVEYQDGSYINFESEDYHLVQFHFHAPSEHTIEAKHYPMEMHLVHKNKDGKILVLAAFVEEGDYNRFFGRILKNSPSRKGKQILSHHKHINLAKVFESTGHAYYYVGSLTTPPCSEEVQWIISSETHPLEYSTSCL